MFWDADVFVLPALAALHPAAARAMLEYRLRRLPAARNAAAHRGRHGARFPWESAGDGSDVTPHPGPGQHGELVPIRTGEEQEHVVVDVAWAACRYAAWTSDTAFLEGPGRPLLVDTARWWATGIRQDAAGRAHIDAVMGPDEYHAVVDDSACNRPATRSASTPPPHPVAGARAAVPVRGQPARVRADRDHLHISCQAPLLVHLAGGPPQRCEPPGRTFPSEVTR